MGSAIFLSQKVEKMNFQNPPLVFQIKFCGKSPALRVAENRYQQGEKRQQ